MQRSRGFFIDGSFLKKEIEWGCAARAALFCKKSSGKLFACRGNNGGKVRRLQGGASDEAAVHIRLAQQLVGVGGVHAAAVLDGRGLGHCLAVQFTLRMAAQTSCAWSAVAVRPVPMAHTGS